MVHSFLTGDIPLEAGEPAAHMLKEIIMILCLQHLCPPVTCTTCPSVVNVKRRYHVQCEDGDDEEDVDYTEYHYFV